MDHRVFGGVNLGNYFIGLTSGVLYYGQLFHSYCFRGDVSSFRLPAKGFNVFMGCLLGQASLHSVDMTDKYRHLHFFSEGTKGVEGYNCHALRYR